MNASKSSTAKINLSHEPMRYTKRFGSTLYTINVYMSQTSRETMQDKILRLVKNETGGVIRGKSILENPSAHGTIKSLQTVRLPGGSS